MAASDAVDHYAVLGVSESAPATEIRRAYLGLARAHHPDFHEAGDEAARSANEREMQRINQAWTILGDPTRRRGYDERRRAAQPGTDSRPRPEPARYDFVPYDDEDIDTDYSALIDDAVEGTEVPRWMQWRCSKPNWPDPSRNTTRSSPSNRTGTGRSLSSEASKNGCQ